MSSGRDEIIRMAREAGYFLYDLTETHGTKTVETDENDQWAQLERFAALVAANEREACAKVVESGVLGHGECAAAIRARGETSAVTKEIPYAQVRASFDRTDR